MGHIIQVSRTVNTGAHEHPIHSSEKTWYVVRTGKEDAVPYTGDTNVCMYDFGTIAPGDMVVEIVPGHWVCKRHYRRIPTKDDVYRKFGDHFSIKDLTSTFPDDSMANVSAWLNFRLPRKIKK